MTTVKNVWANVRFITVCFLIRDFLSPFSIEIRMILFWCESDKKEKKLKLLEFYETFYMKDPIIVNGIHGFIIQNHLIGLP